MASSPCGARGPARDKADLIEETPLRVGDVVADKYVVEDVLAVGGMGVILQARHRTLGQRVAIKVLRSAGVTDDTTQRFLREARAAATIQSEHVARVFDCGSTSGVPYMVIEHLAGRDLHKELKQRGAMPVGEAVDLMAQALEGLAAAHALGIVHRDLKPGNIFLVDRTGPHRGKREHRHVKILDFGISTAGSAQLNDDDLTATQDILGSPRYMSPEQARDSKSVDVRSDIWSLGAILYEMLTGERLIGSGTLTEIITMILYDPFSQLDVMTVPPELVLVLKRCLQRERDDRYPDVASLARDLEPFASERGRVSIACVQQLLGAEAGDATAALTSRAAASSRAAADVESRIVRQRRPRRTALWLSGFAAIAAAIAWYLWMPPTGAAHLGLSAPRVVVPPVAATPSESPPVAVVAPPPPVGPSFSPPVGPVASTASATASAAPAQPAPATRTPRPAPVRILDTSD